MFDLVPTIAENIAIIIPKTIDRPIKHPIIDKLQNNPAEYPL
jgi:hypothetical protein